MSEHRFASPSLPTHAWALYDFANTFFAMNMLSLYFALWVTKDMGAPDLAYSTALSASLLAVAVASPFFGALSDRLGKRTPFVAGFTLLCCLCTALLAPLIGFLGAGALVPALVLFSIAVFGYNLAQVFYNAQLPDLAPPERLGRISGYGTAIGYAGSFVGMLLVMPFVTGKILAWQTPIPGGGNVGAFLPTALFFMLFALPHHLLVRDSARAGTSARLGGGRSFGRLAETWRAARGIPGMVPYLFANLLFFDALNTVIGFMAVYAVKVVGFDEQKQEVQLVLLLATLFAVVGAWAWGRLVDRLGAKRTLSLNLAWWVLSLGAIILVRDKTLFAWVLGPAVGVAMGGTWTASRALLSRLAPPDRQAEFFGLYSLAGKFAAVIGPMTWGLVTYAFSGAPVLKYQLAIACQLLLVLAGGVLLSRVPEPGEALPSQGDLVVG
ncbi:MAG TPA: MFS transporter [Pantanalinema sp.]